MEDNIIHSPYQPIFKLKGYSNLPELLLAKAKENEKNGYNEWMTDSLSGESYTFSQLDDLSKRVGSALYKRGLRSGDIVVFMEIDIVKQPLFLTGVWRANGIARASYPEDDENTLFERVKESRTGWIYCEPFHAEMCLRVAERIYWDVEVIVTSPVDNVTPGCTSIYELFQDDGSELPESKTSWRDTALIMCTSGTTGNSKGAVITQRAIAWQFFAIAKGAPFTMQEGMVNLIFTKSTHISGMNFPFGSLIAGISCVYLTFISRERVLQVVGKYKPSFVFGFPTFLLLLANDPLAAELDLTNLECITGAGAPVTAAIVQALMTLPSMKSVVNVYGLTECAPMIMTVDFDNKRPIPECPPGSLGRLVPGTSAKFVNTETGEANGPGELGELYIKCSGLFKKYYMMPEATKNAFDGEYFKTGDVGYYDEQGFIFLVDRAKDIFKYFNNHVSPTEIENIILAHPAIGEVCVVAIPDLDGGGHVPRAFCVPVGDHNVTTEEILEYTNEKLASYKHLRGGVYFVPELPKGKTGKVTRQLVEQIDVNELT